MTKHLVTKLDQSLINRLAEYLLKKAETLPIGFEIYGNGKPLYYFSPLHLSADKYQWLYRKRNSVLRFEMDTLSLFEKNKGDANAFVLKYGLNHVDYTLTPGAIPVFVGEALVLVVSVTGLSPKEDHQLALEAIVYCKE